jgi:hypothetical protein
VACARWINTTRSIDVTLEWAQTFFAQPLRVADAGEDLPAEHALPDLKKVVAARTPTTRAVSW